MPSRAPYRVLTGGSSGEGRRDFIIVRGRRPTGRACPVGECVTGPAPRDPHAGLPEPSGCGGCSQLRGASTALLLPLAIVTMYRGRRP